MTNTGHKPNSNHPWTYRTWKERERGKENFWDYYRFQAKQEGISPEGLLRLEWTITKNNPCLEKFNHTIQREWLDFSSIGLDDIQEANSDLIKWLIKYNSVRPHKALDYLTPLAYANQIYKLSTMSPTNTTP